MQKAGEYARPVNTQESPEYVNMREAPFLPKG